MAGDQVRPGLKMALEMGPIIAFFVGYLLMRDQTLTLFETEYSGFVVVTACFIPLLALATLATWRMTGKLSGMQVATLVLVTVFGALTVWLNDERFFKMKPTMIYALFAAILGFGLLRERSYLRFAIGETLPLTEEGWMILTRRLTLFCVLLAVLNEIVWRSFPTDIWVSFKTFGLTIGTFAFFLAQASLFQKYGQPSEDGSD